MVSLFAIVDVDTVIIFAHVISVNIIDSLFKDVVMSIITAVSVAILGIAIGMLHSMIGERRILGPLYAETHTGILRPRATQAIIRAVWHLPSIFWAALGIAVYFSRLAGGLPIVSIMAAALFAISGIANLFALRRPFVGGFMLLTTSALCLIDWQIHTSID
jgi:hypothetical protein